MSRLGFEPRTLGLKDGILIYTTVYKCSPLNCSTPMIPSKWLIVLLACTLRDSCVLRGTRSKKGVQVGVQSHSCSDAIIVLRINR